MSEDLLLVELIICFIIIFFIVVSFTRQPAAPSGLYMSELAAHISRHIMYNTEQYLNAASVQAGRFVKAKFSEFEWSAGHQLAIVMYKLLQSTKMLLLQCSNNINGNLILPLN